MTGKLLLHIGKNLSKARCYRTSGSFQKTAWGLGMVAVIQPLENYNFYKAGLCKKVHSLKKWVWSFEILNSTFYPKKKSFFIKWQPFGVQRSIRPCWNKWKWWNRTVVRCFNFLRKKNYVHKSSSRNSTLSLTSKYSWNHLYLFIIFIIYLESFTKVFSTTWTSHWISGSSVKTLVTGLTLFEIAPWVL